MTPGLFVELADERTVTGSAHCTLLSWWASKLGRNALMPHQAAARGGALRCRLADERVPTLGEAVTWLVGELRG